MAGSRDSTAPADQRSSPSRAIRCNRLWVMVPTWRSVSPTQSKLAGTVAGAATPAAGRTVAGGVGRTQPAGKRRVRIGGMAR
jgi:hypothetical protein